ncbi:hypothetical protein Moror_12047 [Moniliophthora roreri MCA 2997]|uniref:Uncharacterized protein n=1 Tax=Moniliophthora roreri (strain MCA 2997) TaxID=1381753 RepID=V2W9Z2_MONRO|nr:hypothetical protein Moror_12047 [Moniliophthora roreri MCA 2997]
MHHITMSNASSASSTSSYHARGLPNPPPGTAPQFSDDITYIGPFNPSPFELLFLVNTGRHNDSLRNTSVGQPHLQYTIDSLIRLRAQRVSLNAIIEKTNVYVANLAFNATASRLNPLILQGPMTVPSLPTNSERVEHQLCTPLSGLGLFPVDICDTDPNDPTFLRAAETYCARIGAAVELAHDQHELCPCCTRTQPVLSGTAGPAPLVPKLEPSPDLGFIKLEPASDSDSASRLVYPSDSASHDSSPLYAQSIGVASASPSPTTEPQPEPALAPPFDPFNVDDEQLTPASVPFLANGQFNPASIQGCSQTPGLPGPPPNTVPAVSVWDDETASETAEQAERRATVEEVHNFLCALCAEWRTTTPVTVRTTIARSADYLRLGIYLGIVVSNEGRIDFLKRIILGAHGLLTTISTGVTTTMTSMETENNEAGGEVEVTDPDNLVPMFVGIPDHEAQEVTLPDGHVVRVVRMGSAM